SGVNGAFLDGTSAPSPAGPNDLTKHSFGTIQLGRYIFPVRNGEAPSGGAVAGTVKDPNGNGVGGAIVQACDANGVCRVSNSGAGGAYSIPGLGVGLVHVTVNPPGDAGNLKSDAGTTTIINTETEILDFALHGPLPLPGNTTVDGHGTTGENTPVLLWT